MHPLSLCCDHNAPEYEDIRTEDFFRALMEEPGGVTYSERHDHHGNAGGGAPPRPIRRQR